MISCGHQYCETNHLHLEIFNLVQRVSNVKKKIYSIVNKDSAQNDMGTLSLCHFRVI